MDTKEINKQLPVINDKDYRDLILLRGLQVHIHETIKEFREKHNDIDTIELYEVQLNSDQCFDRLEAIINNKFINKKTMKTKNLKDIITTIVGLIQLIANVIIQGIDAANGGSINWKTIGFSVVIAIISYFIGKNSDGSAKSKEQLTVKTDPPPVEPPH